MSRFGRGASKDRCILVHGKETIADRDKVSKEFNEFGKVKKIYIDKEGKFAKVYFQSAKKCQEVADAFKVNHLGWTVVFPKSNAELSKLELILRTGVPPSEPSINSSNQELNRDNMMDSMDFADEEEGLFSLNTDYCTLHGDPVTVLCDDDSGEIYVNYQDVKKAGFALFRRENFDALLMDRKQISKEFELFLLAEARTYILKKKVKFSEEEILSTIERCREKVLSGQSNAQTATNDRRSSNASGLNITVTNGSASAVAGSREVFQQPRPPHNNFQTGSSVTNERSHRNDQNVGGNRRGTDRPRDSFRRGGRNCDRSQFGGPQNTNDNDFGKNKPNKNFERNKQAGGAWRGPEPKKQHTTSDAIVPSEKIDNVTLEPGNTYEVIVSYVDNAHIQWVQTKEYHDKVRDMTVELVDAAPSLKDIANPFFGQLVLAQREEVWYRARVISQEPLLVHYLDYGNRNTPSSVKVLPEKYKKMPATALRITGLQNFNLNIQEKQQLRILIRKPYEDGTYLVSLNAAGNIHSTIQGSLSDTNSNESYNAAAAAHSTPKQDYRKNTPPKTMERRPPSRTEVQEDVYMASNLSPLFKLKHDEPVKIVGKRDCRLFLKSKECFEKSKELNEYIKKLDKSGLILGSLKEGQLVLARKDDGVDDETWQRATVVSKEGVTCIQISYIDLPGEDCLAVKALRNVDEHLGNYPALMTISPIFTALESDISSSLEYVDQLIQEKVKLRLVIEGDDIDFKLEDGSLLSKKISNTNKGSSVEPELVPGIKEAAEQQPAKTEEPSSSVNTTTTAIEPLQTPEPLNEQKAESAEPFTFDYMDWSRLSIGTCEVLFYNINDATDITVLSLDEKKLDQLSLVSAVQVKDNTPYEPVEGEMCLVVYYSESEAASSWYRGYITNIDGEQYTAICVDFGNEVVVTPSEIRRLPMNLRDIPMLGILCECVGIPNNEKVTMKLKELLPEGEQAQIKVIECVEEEMKYKIEIPQVYEALKKQGVI